ALEAGFFYLLICILLLCVASLLLCDRYDEGCGCLSGHQEEGNSKHACEGAGVLNGLACWREAA
ncbi:hypothetical protein, partial [Aeromonas salmonicida]|uniref:hypothetical protein n=1 Tax=Aeromonas salmonicida TaxID=645 RepID=UPI001C5FD003